MTEREVSQAIIDAQQMPTRVLVVDDEDVALMVIPEALRDGLEDLGWKNLTIETAASGEEAVEIGAPGDLHLLVTDVVMPGIDGIETFARLKAVHPDMACVVMTAHAPEHSTPIRALKLGAADYVRKPIQPDYLVDTCHRQLVVHHLRRAVSDSRRLLEAIVDSVADGVVAVRGDRLLVANRAARGLLEAEDSTLLDRMRECGLGAAKPDDSGHGAELREMSLSLSDGTRRTVNVTGTAVLSRTGDRLGDVYAVRDITDVIARKQMASFKQMAAIAAHEMKNSVTGLGLVTEHLIARLESGSLQVPEAQRMARIILDSVGRLDRFARSFLGFSRIPEPRKVRVSPNTLVEDALALYDREKGLPEWVDVQTSLALDMPAVDADPDLMFQVLQNLILNAVEAMESTRRGGLELKTEPLELSGGQYCAITVTDQGGGVPEHMRDKIFEPNVTTREAGSGLGLVVVSDIVHKHGGHVRLRSREGEGASFEVLLPVADETPGDLE